MLSLLTGLVSAQSPVQPLREKNISSNINVHQLDTLSIIPGTFQISTPDNDPLLPAFYKVEYFKAVLSLSLPPDFKYEYLDVRYEVYPINFSQPIFRRDTSLISLPGMGEPLTLTSNRQGGLDERLSGLEGLTSSGSITRGLTLGNRQDPALNSAMNLQLNGNLSKEFQIAAVISDQNIPFQPDGTTQQIQDFDRVYLEVFNDNMTIVAGDFNVNEADPHFLKFNKKLRGVRFNYQNNEYDTPGNDKIQFKSQSVAAISRGKYNRMTFDGIEGNQGPYRLTGADNETFIVVLSGSERVYLDGRLLKRGMEFDYIIDYNTAEITFNPQIAISQFSRIAVEFEYAERNYVRSMLYSTNQWQINRANFAINVFSEQDHPNQTIFQELSSGNKDFLSLLGDNTNEAFDYDIDSVGFRNDRVMYRITDTLGYDSVFVYSTDPDWAVYNPGFTFVGAGKGNYLQAQSGANGIVYRWIEPVDGEKQGTHEPAVFLVAPRSRQVVSASYKYDFKNNISTGAEYAFSRNDINLFSDLDEGNDIGHALKVFIKNDAHSPKDSVWRFDNLLEHEMVTRNFTTAERLRSVEFDRNWNIRGENFSGNEHLTRFSFQTSRKKLGIMAYQLARYQIGDSFEGYKNKIVSDVENRFLVLDYDGSLLLTSGNKQTQFYRHISELILKTRFMNFGIKSEMERNIEKHNQVDSLLQSSRYFYNNEFFIADKDREKNRWRVFYRSRLDFFPRETQFIRSLQTRDYGANLNMINGAFHKFRLVSVFRESDYLNPEDESDNGNTLNIRIDHSFSDKKSVFKSDFFYQANGAREREIEFIYVEVPAGQGVYIWNDYNENDIKELDEFDLSPFPQEADHVRLFLPGNEFISTFQTIVNHSISINPARLWRDETGIKKFLSQFSNRTNYRIDKKRQETFSFQSLYPVPVDIDDSLLMSLNSSIRNSLFFNRGNPLYSLEYSYQNISSKNLLSNGFETRLQQSHLWRFRVRAIQNLTLSSEYMKGINENGSDFFQQRNYKLRYQKAESALSYQVMQNSRIKLSGGYYWRENIMGSTGEWASDIFTALDARWGFPGKGKIESRYKLSVIQYPFDTNTPLAFEILQALHPGVNHLWSINLHYNINSYLQLNLSYQGRKPPDLNSIHTGNVTLRANF